ncbi:MAG: nucleotide exchange factor GrpE [Candidatus Margulisiibacteriota bacterium]
MTDPTEFETPATEDATPAPSAETQPMEATPEAVLEAEITGLKEQVAIEKDKALRAAAELENFKRRKENEVEQFKKFALERFVLELLPVLDSFDRAASANTDEQNLKEGFELIQKQFQAVLEKLGVSPFEAVGTPFDPNLHQAVLQEANKEVEAGTVVKEFQKGYKLQDRVIRAAMVVVAE